MRPFEVDIDPANVDLNGICAAITGAGPWTIADAEFVANDSGDSLAHRLNLTSAAALGAIEAESGAPDQALTVDVVFGDGDSVNAGEIDAANNGAHTATSAYKVGAAILTITKTEAIISDPINGTGANRLHIPGAVIEYTITIANGAGGAEATNVTLTDVPDTGNMTFSTTTYDGGNCALAPCGIQVTSPNINLGAAQNLTNASDGDVGIWDGTTVTVSGISLLATESATITYRLTIK